MNILICDDHPIVRQGLKDIITRISGFTVVGEVGDGDAALQFISRNPVEVLILDISLPGRDGIEILKQVKSIHPDIRVLILSMHAEEQYAQRAFRNGAHGYITKNNVVAELSKALTNIVAGRKYISDHFSALLLDSIGGGVVRRYKKLTDREYQVFIQIAAGKPVGQIARELLLSVKTVSTYRHRVLEKMQLKQNAELTRYAIENGLLD
ncbi:MAG: response regulator transcription factor [Candidatus Neomarinimicrobiota bacterium]